MFDAILIVMTVMSFVSVGVMIYAGVEVYKKWKRS